VLPLAFEVVATPDLLRGHALSFTEVGFDDAGIRIEYSIAPVLATRGAGARWVGHGRDDLGNDYADLGAAYGQARDGDRTDGVLTMPFPVDEARMLRVRLRPGGDAAGFEDDGSPAYEVLVHLEL